MAGAASSWRRRRHVGRVESGCRRPRGRRRQEGDSALAVVAGQQDWATKCALARLLTAIRRDTLAVGRGLVKPAAACSSARHTAPPSLARIPCCCAVHRSDFSLLSYSRSVYRMNLVLDVVKASRNLHSEATFRSVAFGNANGPDGGRGSGRRVWTSSVPCTKCTYTMRRGRDVPCAGETQGSIRNFYIVTSRNS